MNEMTAKATPGTQQESGDMANWKELQRLRFSNQFADTVSKDKQQNRKSSEKKIKTENSNLQEKSAAHQEPSRN